MPVGSALLVFGPTIGIRAGSAISCARAHSGGVGPKPSGHQCVTREIVGISPTLVVGGELNQLKKGGSHSPLGLAFGV